jgi:hypothetical protein
LSFELAFESQLTGFFSDSTVIMDRNGDLTIPLGRSYC